MLLAAAVAAIWGFAFVATKVALGAFSPAQLVVLRFTIAALPAALLVRPPVPWATLLGAGTTLFAGQFLLQFFGIHVGTPAGLAAVTVQTQAFFTVLLAALALGERPRRRELAGMALAAAGLGLIALTVGADLRPLGLALTLGSALSWAVGNLQLKRIPRADMLALVAWLSLVPPLPALALSLAWDGPGAWPAALRAATWLEVGAALYLGVVATTLAYAVWGHLLRIYPAAQAAPFALLAPIVGGLASAGLLGESFGPLRIGGMACVLAGLAVIVLPWPRRLPIG